MMEVAQQQQQQLDEEFVCPVCLSILLEPTTINCGHNVCRGCLAGWYLSNVPRRDECPTCRQKWEGYPQVNKTLRTVIERLEPQTLMEHREEVQQNKEYLDNLEKFEKEVKQKVTGAVQAKQNTPFFAGVAVAVFASIVIYFFVYWGSSADSAKRRAERPVAMWATEDVVQWLESMGWAHNYSISAKQHGVDGPMLLYQEMDHLMKLLDVTDISHRSALQVAIGTLQEKGVRMPQTLWEYKALYPGRSLYLSYALKDFPRCAMVYLYLFYYEDSFLPFIHTTLPREWDEELRPSQQKLPQPGLSQWLMFWLLMMVFPYGMLGLFAWSLRSAHTITHLVVMATCLFQTLFELSFLSSCVMQGRWREWKKYVEGQVKQIMSMVIYVCLWPITPSFICSTFFYVCLYVSPIQLGKKFYNIALGRRH